MIVATAVVLLMLVAFGVIFIAQGAKWRRSKKIRESFQESSNVILEKLLLDVLKEYSFLLVKKKHLGQMVVGECRVHINAKKFYMSSVNALTGERIMVTPETAIGFILPGEELAGETVESGMCIMYKKVEANDSADAELNKKWKYAKVESVIYDSGGYSFNILENGSRLDIGASEILMRKAIVHEFEWECK